LPPDHGPPAAGHSAGHWAVLVVALWLVTTLLWLTPGLTRPDGAGYFVYLPSTWFDHDLLFFDEWAKVGLIRDGRILFKDATPAGYLSNHWTAGSSMAWYPAFVAGDALARTIGEAHDGFSPPYVTAIVFTSALAGLFVLLAGFRIARPMYGEGAAAASAMAIWLGSPLAFYSLRHASMSHAISAAACAGVVLLSLRLREQVTWQRLFACGLAIGFACAVRPQNIFIALVPFLVGPPASRRLKWRRSAPPGGEDAGGPPPWILLLAGALLAALPQLIVSQTLWHAPLAFVNIGGRAHPWQMFTTFRPFETIFSWYHGLATWTPLLLIAIAGFALLWRDDRGLARAAIVMFGAQWLVLSVLERWFWGGASFGQRRFDSCTIFFILGLAAVLRRVPRWLGTSVTIAATAWTVLLFIASTNLNLNRFQTPVELLDAFRGADSRWRTFLGFAPRQILGEMVMTIAVVAILAAIVVLLMRRHAIAMATVYLIVMSAFYAWCGMHPKRDAFSRALIARQTAGPALYGSARDTATLLGYEADYMMRTGRPEAARKALREAAEIVP